MGRFREFVFCYRRLSRDADADGLCRQSVSRRYSFPLRAGHKTAYLCTETTMYRYVDSLEAPKKWFKANVDSIMQIFGAEHRIQKEDLFLGVYSLSLMLCCSLIYR